MNASVEFLDSSFLNWDHGYSVISEDIATYSRQGEKERVGFQNKQKIYVVRDLWPGPIVPVCYQEFLS
jgi:hypothetical protein